MQTGSLVGLKEKRLFDSFDVYARYRMQQADGKEGKRHREGAREEYKCGNEINKERAWRALVQLMQRLFPTIWLPQLSKRTSSNSHI